MLLTLQNVGRVLDLYSVQTPERGAAEVGRALNMSRSKAHLLLSSMAEIGMLRRVPGGRYQIGWRALQLDRIAAETTPFRMPGRGAAAALARRTGETVHLAALDNGRVVYVDRMQGERALPIAVSQIGATLPAHCTGVGKVLLASVDAEQIDAILDAQGLPALTARTITDRAVLHKELARVRERGYANDREEVVAGLACVAAPIRDHGGQVVAAISLSMPVARLSSGEEGFRRLILTAAAAVTKRVKQSREQPAAHPLAVAA